MHLLQRPYILLKKKSQVTGQIHNTSAAKIINTTNVKISHLSTPPEFLQDLVRKQEEQKINQSELNAIWSNLEFH